MYNSLIIENYEDLTDHQFEVLKSLLPEERKLKVNRLRKRQDKCASLIAWFMIDYLLNKIYNISYWTFKVSPNGKPYIEEYKNIFFSISHCPYGCFCAVSDSPIGVDIQDIREFNWEIARYACCIEEIKVLQQTEDKAALFTEMWCIKESILKMTGQGIGYGLKKINSLKYRNNVIVVNKTSYVIALANFDSMEGELCLD